MAANGQKPKGPDGKPKPPPGAGRMKPEEAMKRIDANHDGAISYQEQMDFALHDADMRFSHMDANHDGRLTQSEIDAAEKQRESMKVSNGHGTGNGGPAGPAGHKPPGGGLDSLLTRADTNHDGAVDQSENRAAAQQQVARRFQNADKNADGRLEKGEMQPPPRPPQQQAGQ